MSTLITRAFTDAEVRTTGDGGRTLVGIAAPFDTPIEVGGYTESIRRGAFARTIAERGPGRVKVLSQHNDRSNPIGRASLLREDPAGLYAELKVSKTQAGDEVLELIRDGALDGLSIGFIPVTDQHHPDRNLVERTEVRLQEISCVTWPAYADARVSQVRSSLTPSASLDLARRRTALAAILSGASHEL